MHDSRLTNFIFSQPQRLAMPIGVYAGLEMTGATVRAAVTDAAAQSEAVLALHTALDTRFLLTAMDLSAEAEEFGCEIRMDDADIPTVIGRLVRDGQEIDALAVPPAGSRRTRVHLDSASRLLALAPGVPVLGGLIGPFSLAGRLFGVSQILELTITDPQGAHMLLEKTARYLTEYALAFRETGAWGVIMAEPAAGLLSPRALAVFSSAYVERITLAVQTSDFSLVYHNCGAKLAHLARIMECGTHVYHFGAPMDIPAALAQVGGSPILCGNLDPTAIFHQGAPEEVGRAVAGLLEMTSAHRNFVLSSGCDIPPGTPLENMKALFESLREYNHS